MRTDLAAECLNMEQELPRGILCHRQPLEKGAITLVEVSDEEGAKNIGKPMGIYITMETEPLWLHGDAPELVEALAGGLGQLLPQEGCILVVGLGNREITADGLGPAAAEKIFVTRHLTDHFSDLRQVAALAPNVLGKTGMEAMETIQAVVCSIKPSAVIAIDAMAAASPQRLGCTVQLANSGIVPGSGVMNSRKALNAENLHVPVIALGIPTVTEVGEAGGEPMLCTPRQIDQLIQRGANLLAMAINRALHPSLSLEELLLLQS